MSGYLDKYYELAQLKYANHYIGPFLKAHLQKENNQMSPSKKDPTS